MNLGEENDNKQLKKRIEEKVWEYAKEHLMSLEEEQRYVQEIFNSLKRLDVLEELLQDDTVTEIMVNGYQKIFYEKRGKLYSWNKQFSGKDKLENVIQRIVAKSNRVVNESMPIVDARLEDGSRIHIVLEPVSIDGSCITIRKFPKESMTMEKLLSLGTLNCEMAEFLKELVRTNYNIFISGGTGSGKTTFLNALSGCISKEERIITIEDSAELQLNGVENLIRLETRNANMKGMEEITIRDLIRAALRMRPDRIIVGECRGAEALDMLQAMNTGHDGSLSTGHANTCEDMLRRLETMVLLGMELPLPAIRSQIASGVDILIHVGRMRDGSRKVINITEILGYEDHVIHLNPIWQLKSQKGLEDINGEWKCIGTLKNTQKIENG
ncbi:MAG: CpaF family protein [Lachnospiraceae bacterium]|nr:CpaF family protein [Lachnospiraceae bacterium]